MSTPSGSTTITDLYFAPDRDETVAVNGVPTSSNMMLRITLNNDPNPTAPTQYVTKFGANASWNPSLIATPIPTGVANVTNQTTLVAALADSNDRTIYLPNSVIQVDQPLDITHSVTILGTGSSSGIQFTPGPGGAAWAYPSDAPNGVGLSTSVIKLEAAPTPAPFHSRLAEVHLQADSRSALGND